MVWYNGGSDLYDAVERHNSKASAPETEPVHEVSEKCCPTPERDKGPLEMLFKDRDAMLLTALLLILMHEKADKKLILALAFVLFS